jgi:hypothetical protein
LQGKSNRHVERSRLTARPKRKEDVARAGASVTNVFFLPWGEARSFAKVEQDISDGVVTKNAIAATSTDEAVKTQSVQGGGFAGRAATFHRVNWKAKSEAQQCAKLVIREFQPQSL